MLIFDTIICGYNIFCHFDNIIQDRQIKKYPPDVAQLCIYFEQQNTKLPDYCFYETTIKKPRHRNEF